MQSDDIVWEIINHQHCSFKVKSETQNFCRNKYNVTGLCNRMSCPLANSNYATVREAGGSVYLYMKVVERAHLPAKLWERVRLSSDPERAQAQIERNLMYWPGFLQDKCKERAGKIREYLRRMEKLKKVDAPSLVPIKQKTERREATREQKALTAARLEKSLERELIARLKSRTYGDNPLNINEDLWQSLLNREKEAELGLESDAETDMDENELEEERQFVSDLEESDDDIEDGSPFDGDDDGDEDGSIADGAEDRSFAGDASDTSDAASASPEPRAPKKPQRASAPRHVTGQQHHQTGLGSLVPGKKRPTSAQNNKAKRARPSVEIEYEMEGPQYAK